MGGFVITRLPFPWMFFGPRPAGDDAFSPSSLFAGGEDGAWYDPSDLATVWADTAGTTPASVDGAVARIDDKSGNALHLTNATAGRRPLLKTSGGLYWLEFDGSDDSLWSSGNLNLASEQASVCYAVQRTEDVAYVRIIAAVPASDPGCFIMGGTYLGDGDVAAQLDTDTGPETVEITDASYGVAANVITAAFDRNPPTGGSATVRVNGAPRASSTEDNGGENTGNFVAAPLYIGADAGIANPFTGKLFGIVIRAGTLTAGQLSGLETWMQTKSGATF